MKAGGFFKRLVRDCSGATIVEYGLIVALIAVGIIVSLNAFSSASRVGLNAISTSVQNST